MLSKRDPHSQGLELQLFGSWCLWSEGAEVRIVGRAQRLVALLALQGQRARPHVAGILWPDTTEGRALTSLRAAVLQTQRAVPQLLEADRTHIALGRDVHVDVEEMRRCASQVLDETPGDGRAAVRALSGAELLPGWYDDWVVVERERLQHQRLRALERLAEISLARHDIRTALTAALEAIAIEPLLESTRILVVRAHLQAGNRAAAVREFAGYRRLLDRELHIAPSPVLFNLVRHLGVGERDQHPSAVGSARAARAGGSRNGTSPVSAPTAGNGRRGRPAGPAR
jgi:DNA-binding SARP family transcriptional activator